MVTGVDLRRQPVVVTGTGELARCLQHETDHLRGELYIDGLTGPERAQCHAQAPRADRRTSLTAPQLTITSGQAIKVTIEP